MSASGEVLIETENGFLPDRDMTRARGAAACDARHQNNSTRQVLAGCTLYTSAEPCAMCAGAIYWAGIGRVVFGLSERRLKAMTGDHAENPTLDLPCRTVFARRPAPRSKSSARLLEEEAAALHAGVWDAAERSSCDMTQSCGQSIALT